MSPRRFFLVSVVLGGFARVGHVLAYVGPLIMMPLMYLVRDAPVADINLFIASIKPTAYRLIALLKPEYRESWLTDGHSLPAG